MTGCAASPILSPRVCCACVCGGGGAVCVCVSVCIQIHHYNRNNYQYEWIIKASSNVQNKERVRSRYTGIRD